MTTEHKDLDYLKGKFEDGDRPTGDDFARLLDSCHNTKQMTDVTITKNLDVQGVTLLEQDVTINSDLTTQGRLQVDSDTQLMSSMRLHGPGVFDQTFTVQGSVSLNNTLNVAGVTNIHNILLVQDGVTLQDTLQVHGAVILSNGLIIAGDVVMDSNLVTHGTIFANTMQVSGATDITGPVTISGTLHTDDTTINTLKVSGAARFDEHVHIKGDLRVDGNAYLSAGTSGVINVGDTDQDNINFNADVSSNITPNNSNTHDLGSDTNKWRTTYTNDIVVDGLVDGRDISTDGQTLDNTHSVVSTTSAQWNQTHAHVSANGDTWDDTSSVVQSNSASWEETADINEIINNISPLSADWTAAKTTVFEHSDDWNNTYTTVKSNSSDWEIDQLVDLKDVDATGIENNSILRYESTTNKWVASTVEDEVVKATAALIVFDHGSDSEIPLNGLTLSITDNNQDAPYRTVTFTADSAELSGVNTKIDSTNYTYGTSGLSASPVNMNNIAAVVVDVINLANAEGDISILAGQNNNRIILQQQYGGPGGNTDITGTAVGNSNQAFLHDDNGGSIHHPKFTGGANLNTFASMDDTPAGYGSDAEKFVKVNSTNNGLEFVEHNTSDWDTVVTTVNTNSASWEETADINAIINSISGVSGDWNSVYTDVSETSADWNSVYTSVSTTSSTWDSVYTDVSETSADWNSVYTSVSTTSANWDTAYSDFESVSAQRDAVITKVENASANWDSVYTDVSETSADWNSVYTSVGTTSANWDNVYNYVQTTSGDGYATLDSTGKLLTDQIPELSITRVHVVQNPGDVVNLSPTEGIQVGDVVIVVTTFDNLIAVDTTPGDFGTYNSGTESYSGYNKLALPADLVQTINGNTGPHVILTTDDIDPGSTNMFTTQGQQDMWSDTSSVVQSNSASWEETADIDAIINSISGVSANWDDTYTNVSNISAARDSVITKVEASSGSWDDTYTFVSGDSGTNNTDYNHINYVAVSGDSMNGSLDIVGGELAVGGNVTIAGDLIHQGDTGTRIAYSEDTITLETNSQEYITIDGTASTPNQVIINNPNIEPVDFTIKSVNLTSEPAFFVDGTDGKIGINTEMLTTQFNVSGDSKFTGDMEITGDSSAVNGTYTGDVNITGDISTTGIITSGGTILHDIFTTSDDVHGDLTVHGSISAQSDIITSGTHKVSGDIICEGDARVSGDITITGSLTADNYTSTTGYSVLDGGIIKPGITQDINIGGHILHIVNGLIVGVTDE